MSSPIMIAYYGQVQSFTYQQLYDGTFDTWINSIYNKYKTTSPCQGAVATTTTTTTTTLATTIVNGVMNLNSIASIASMGTSINIGGTTNIGTSGTGQNNSNSSDNNSNSDNNNGSSTGNSGNPGSESGSGSTGGTDGGSGNNGGSVSGNGGSNGNDNGGSGNTNQGGNPPANQGGSGSSEDQGGQVGNNNNNNGGNNNDGNGGSGGSNSGSSGGNSGNSGGQGDAAEETPPTPEEQAAAEEQQQSSSSQQTTKSTSKAKTEVQKPAILMTGDIVGIQKADDGSQDVRGTASFTRVKGDGTASLGFSADYMVNAKIANVTAMRSWIGINEKGNKHINVASDAITVLPKSFTNTALFVRVNSLKNFTGLYGAAGTYGKMFDEEIISTLAIAGFMYKGSLAKSLDATIIAAGVWAPYTKFYTESFLESRPIIIPFLNLNYKLTKTFGIGLTGGGTYVAGQNILNYQVLCGAKLIL